MATIIARPAGNGPQSTESHVWHRQGEHAVDCQGNRVALVDLRVQAAATCRHCAH